jgi:capsular polysaccharide biosynthesis protein
VRLEAPRFAEGPDVAVPRTRPGEEEVGGNAFVAVSVLVAAVRRRWRVWTATAALGVAVAIGFSVAFPPSYSATTTLLLAHRSNADASRAMVTDNALLETTTVARQAVGRLGLRMSPTDFAGDYEGTVLSNDLLQVTVRGESADDALRRADAVAASFLAFRADEAARQSDLALRALEDRARTVAAELKDVNDRINATAPEPTSDAAVREFGELLTRRAALTTEQGELQEQMRTTEADARSIRDNSRVIDAPSVDPRSPLKALLTNAAAGLVAGLAVGVGRVVVGETAFDRVRRRDELAAALRAPVPVSVGRLPGRGPRQRRRFQEHLLSPNEEIVRMVRQLRRSLGHSVTPKPGLVVVSVRSDWPAALAVVGLAAELTREGSNVLLGDFSQESAVGQVLGVGGDETAVLQLGSEASELVVAFPGGERHLEVDELRKGTDVVLSLAALDPAFGAVHLAAWGTVAVAVVTSGRSSATVLGSVSQMLDAAGIELDCTILVGADRTDETTGMSGWESPPPRVEMPSFWADR